jgi:general secretion pathway protein I
MKRTRPGSERGFTLLEVLIAAVVMATVFVAVMGLLSKSLRNIDRLKPHEIALAHAQEKMNEVLILESLTPGTSAGSWDDGYRWQVDVENAPVLLDPEQAAQQKTDRNTWGLFRVRVEISWGTEAAPKGYEIETLQWAKKDKGSAS